MNNDLLLIIDMQNVYAAGGNWCCPGTEAAAENILRMLSAKATGDRVIFTQFLADETPEGVWRDYNRENAAVNADAHANAMMPCFAQALTEYPLYTKSVYSSLAIPEVVKAAKEAERVVVTGVVAECCVLATALALIDAGVKVVYLTDAVAGISPETEAATETVLAGLEPLHVIRMTTDEYLESNREK